MRAKTNFIRGLSWSVASALVLAAACGGNPEVAFKDQQTAGLGGVGAPCVTGGDCSQGLICGEDSKCASACGSVTSRACGDEVCLPSGACSQGVGRTCSAQSGCTDGLVCSTQGRCAMPCVPSTMNACKGGASCEADGTCPSEEIDLGLGGGANSGGGGDGSGGDGSCIDVAVEFTPQIPSVLLLIDRSGSMNADNFGKAVSDAVAAGTYELGDCPKNNDWRWNVVRDVLMNPTKGIVKPLEDRVRFGLSLYSSDEGRVKAGSPEEVDTTKACPVLIDVPIALNNHGPMLDKFICSDIYKDTPTGESLQAAAATLKAFQEPGPKVIVLATDGLPDTCECPNFSGNGVPAKCRAAGMLEKTQQEVVAIAQQIHGDDITVHVINVSTPTEAALQAHLTEVATAGGGNVYPGFSPGALSSAFEEIIDGARSCVIDLNGTIAKGKESTGVITLDGVKLGLDDADGWQVNSPTQIELLGQACETIKRGDHDLSIKFPCGSFEPVVH